MSLLQLVVASANPDKVAEMAFVLEGIVDLLPRPKNVPEVEEDQDTLEGNARLKAQAITHATGLPALADDTGLFVDALGGAPGVWSARYAGEQATYQDNVDNLLKELTGVAPERRTARFQTVVLLCFPDGTEITATGTVEGRIAQQEQGQQGFGYDPLFVPVEGDGRSFAEMGDEKHVLSHRGRSLRSFARQLDALKSS